MSLYFRSEYNVVTEEISKVPMILYKTTDDMFMLLDATEVAPEGYVGMDEMPTDE